MSDQPKRGVIEILTAIEERVKTVQDLLPMRQQQLALNSQQAEPMKPTPAAVRRNAPLPKKPNADAFEAVPIAVEELNNTHPGGYTMGELRDKVFELAPGCLGGSNGNMHAQIRLIMCKTLGLKVMWGGN